MLKSAQMTTGISLQMSLNDVCALLTTESNVNGTHSWFSDGICHIQTKNKE
jgi:hypothetical protein